MSPAVGEALQIRLALAGVVGNRLFFNLQVLRAGLHNHLAGELHARRRTVHGLPGVAAKHAHPTMRVTDASAVEDVQELRQQWIPDVFVQRRHRPGENLALQSRPHGHVGVAGANHVQQLGKLLEVVGAVGVAHGDVVAADALEGVQIRVAVALAVGLDDDGTIFRRNLGRAVGRAVRDDDLAVNLHVFEGGFDPLDTLGDATFFVEGGHHDREGGCDITVCGQQ